MRLGKEDSRAAAQIILKHLSFGARAALFTGANSVWRNPVRNKTTTDNLQAAKEVEKAAVKWQLFREGGNFASFTSGPFSGGGT